MSELRSRHGSVGNIKSLMTEKERKNLEKERKKQVEKEKKEREKQEKVFFFHSEKFLPPIFFYQFSWNFQLT